MFVKFYFSLFLIVLFSMVCFAQKNTSPTPSVAVDQRTGESVVASRFQLPPSGKVYSEKRLQNELQSLNGKILKCYLVNANEIIIEHVHSFSYTEILQFFKNKNLIVKYTSPEINRNYFYDTSNKLVHD